tara:strand:- start:48 stop:1667 length:1620 start_codon:yes stop_codon:yes gene_type:complete
MKYHDIQLTGSLQVTGSLSIPVGTTAERPTNPKSGSLRLNSSNGRMEIYTAVSGSQWEVVGAQTTASAASPNDIEYLVVAGGGGGGGVGGAGGAGGYLTNTITSVAGTEYTITIGGGGAASATGGSGNGDGAVGASGTNSIFSTITSLGGGGGAGGGNAALSGGSGGGSRSGTVGSGTTGQGNSGAQAGSYIGGGGGGAGEAGNTSMKGGDGLQSSITGTPTYYAGGGGGGGNTSGGGYGVGGAGGGASAGGSAAGTVNTGGGGCGGTWTNNSNYTTQRGGAGGSGVAIFAYSSGSTNGAGGIVGDAGNGKKYHQFNSSGNFAVGSNTDFQIPKQSNLSLLWRPDDFSSRGTSTITDLSSSGRNGTISGPSLGANPYYTFDGSNDKITHSLTRTNTAQTLILWMRFDGNGSNGYSLSGYQEGTSYNYMGRLNTGNVYYYMGNGTGGDSGYALSLSTWYMLTNTVDSSGNHNSYVDTTSRVSNSGINMGTTGTLPLTVGAIGSASTYFHNGLIGPMALYNDHFTQADVESFYNATKTNFV